MCDPHLPSTSPCAALDQSLNPDYDPRPNVRTSEIWSCCFWDSINHLDARESTNHLALARPESSGPSSSKACREKLGLALTIKSSSILESGRPPKTDKAAILVDAARMVTQLKSQAQKLKNSNLGLQEKIKELKRTVKG
ncbi:hypothetical protein V2J09_002679 [Rumex salicifolius]